MDDYNYINYIGQEIFAVYFCFARGSSSSISIPLVCTEDGYSTISKGTILNLEVYTSLEYRNFLKCDIFNVRYKILSSICYSCCLRYYLIKLRSSSELILYHSLIQIFTFRGGGMMNSNGHVTQVFIRSHGILYTPIRSFSKVHL